MAWSSRMVKKRTKRKRGQRGETGEVVPQADDDLRVGDETIVAVADGGDGGSGSEERPVVRKIRS